jgi:sulfur carrier protein ThiS
MKVAVKLHGILRDYRPQGVKIDLFELTLPDSASVQDAVEYFGIPSKAVHAVFLNGEVAEINAALKDGDHVRLFPPVVGGSEQAIRIFIAGVMQGSRRENSVSEQDYRQTISIYLQQHVPDIEIVDPWRLHPDSVSYNNEDARRTLIDLAKEAGRVDAVIAFVPEASMGTALEMWEAYHQQRPIFTISPLIHNWVVKCLSTQIFEDMVAFRAFVASGEFSRQVRNRT